MRTKKIQEAIRLAKYIRDRFDTDGIFEYEAVKKLEDIAYGYEIDVYFDEDNIPEQVEDFPI